MSDRAAPRWPGHLRYGLRRVSGRKRLVVRQVIRLADFEAVDDTVEKGLVVRCCRVIIRTARRFLNRDVELGGEGVADGNQAIGLHRAFENLLKLSGRLFLQEHEWHPAQHLDLRRFLHVVPGGQGTHWHAQRECEVRPTRLVRASDALSTQTDSLFTLRVAMRGVLAVGNELGFEMPPHWFKCRVSNDHERDRQEGRENRTERCVVRQRQGYVWHAAVERLIFRLPGEMYLEFCEVLPRPVVAVLESPRDPARERSSFRNTREATESQLTRESCLHVQSYRPSVSQEALAFAFPSGQIELVH